MNSIAIEFVRDVLRKNPEANEFAEIYDALCRAACRRTFHNLGYYELALAGISFSLLKTNTLEALITEANHSLTNNEGSRGQASL